MYSCKHAYHLICMHMTRVCQISHKKLQSTFPYSQSSQSYCMHAYGIFMQITVLQYMQYVCISFQHECTQLCFVRYGCSTCMHIKTTCMYIFSTQVCLQSLFLTLIRQLQNICMHVYLICMHMVLINIPKLYLFVYIYPRIYIVYFLDLNPNQLLYLLSGVSYILFDIFIIFELLKNNKNNIILLNIYSSILRRIYIIKKNIQCYAFFLLAVYEKIINQLFQLMHKLILNLIALLFSIEYQITKIMHLI
eukprot:TRINITY_DN8317_c0_g1_i3.p3 TRINITY_DN8317_c0_g1~~TRINITY_DN8317_c0_g1_i3.p3  ORF type:complete len:249 (-),score=-24.59 TRINITY_DN8317_c0_g1_i3:587-1333(-)